MFASTGRAKGVNVTAVCPGFVRTPLVEQSLTNYPDQSLRGVSIEHDGDRIAHYAGGQV